MNNIVKLFRPKVLLIFVILALQACSKSELESKYPGLDMGVGQVKYCGLTYDGPKDDVELFVLNSKSDAELVAIIEHQEILKILSDGTDKSVSPEHTAILFKKYYEDSLEIAKKLSCIVPKNNFVENYILWLKFSINAIKNDSKTIQDEDFKNQQFAITNTYIQSNKLRISLKVLNSLGYDFREVTSAEYSSKPIKEDDGYSTFRLNIKDAQKREYECDVVVRFLVSMHPNFNIGKCVHDEKTTYLYDEYGTLFYGKDYWKKTELLKR